MEFYDLLYAAISDSDKDCNDLQKNNDENDAENICLITYEMLKSDHVKLECSHTFNYIPLFNEIYNQKHKANALETQKLTKSQIKCPYCRTVQNKILPPKDNFQKALYVNYPLKYCMTTEYCKYVFKSGYKKGQQCGRGCFSTYCSSHKQYSLTKPLTPKQLMVSKYKQDILDIRKHISSINDFLKNDLSCCNEKCKNICVGDLITCYRHASKDEKNKIKNMRDEKKKFNSQIRDIRETIKNIHI